MGDGVFKKRRTCDKPHYENEDFAIPNSWTMAEMSDLFLLNPKNEVDDETEVGFVPMACVEDGFSGNHSFETRKWEDVKKGYCHFQNGDIGVAKISPCFENLKSCILHSLPNGVGTGTTELVILRSLGVYVPFYMYLFKSSWYISQGTKYFKGVVGQQRVNKAIFTDLKVPLPSVAEQKRIVAEIKRWFAFIDIIEHEKSDLQENIKQTKSKILDLAIHGELVPQDPNDEPATELLKRINPKAEITCDNPQYENLPNGWCRCTLKDIGIFESGYAFSSDEYKQNGVPLVRISNITNNGNIDLSSCVYIQNYNNSKFIIHEGDLLIAMSGATTGKMGVYKYKTDALLNQRVGNLKCTEAWLQQYRNYFMLAKSNYILNIAYGGAQPNISAKAILSIKIDLPPIKEQHRIVAKIEELFTQLDKIEVSL